MADGALTREGVLAGLQDIRLPAEAAGGALAEALAAFGLGLLLASGIAMLTGLVTARRRTAPRPRASAPPRSEEALQLALLAELKTTHPDCYARLADRLYRPGGMPSVADLTRDLGR